MCLLTVETGNFPEFDHDFDLISFYAHLNIGLLNELPHVVTPPRQAEYSFIRFDTLHL